MPTDGGEAIQLTWDGGWAPLESPDGKFLYYTKNLRATSVWRVHMGGGQAAKVLEGLSTYLNLAIVDKGIYFVPLTEAASASSIQFLDLQTHQIRRIASFERPVGSWPAYNPNIAPPQASTEGLFQQTRLFTTVKIYCSIGAAIGSCNFETPAFQSGEQSLEGRKRKPAQLNPGTDALRWPPKVRSLL